MLEPSSIKQLSFSPSTFLVWTTTCWASPQENRIAYKQKDADQPPHLRSLVSDFDIRYLESAHYLLTYICKVSTLYPVCTS